MPYLPGEVEEAERRKDPFSPDSMVQYHLKYTGGRRGCPHPVHRFAKVPDSPASLILPECAGQEAWLAARLDGVGGSEVGALVGVSEYDTPLSVWNTKMNGGKDLSALAAIEWGHRLEDVVAQKTADEIGLTSRFGGGLWARRDNPVLRVTPDRFATRPRAWTALGVIECKTAGDDEHWESGTIRPSGDGTGSAPIGYQAQVQWQLGVLGLKIGWLGCLVMGRERQFFVVEIHFDAEWFAEMEAEATRFFAENVRTGVPPMATLRHPKTEELLKQIHPAVVRPSVDLPEGTETWLRAYHEAKQAAEKAATEFDSIKNYFRMHTGDAGAAYLGEQKIVSYPVVTTHGIDLEKLRTDYPEVAEACVKKSTHRRLTIRVPKEYKTA